jgi:hypothetical protein
MNDEVVTVCSKGNDWQTSPSMAEPIDIEPPDSDQTIRVEEVRLGRKAEWNAFAESCQGTYMCSHGYITAYRFHRRLRVLAIFQGTVKIGQCAVIFGRFGRYRHVGEFVDAIQLLPAYTLLWAKVMETVLRTLGSGTYTYGSKWSIETPRHVELARLPGVSISQAKYYLTQVVDFSKWPTWEAYEKAISSNVKRNAAKATKADPATAVVLKQGIKAATEALSLTKMRFLTRRRKGMEDWTSFHVAILRYIARTVFMRQLSYTAKVVHKGQTSAYFSGIDFGSSTFYIDGASLADNGGSAWLLILAMLRRSWQPNGKFFLAMYEVNSVWVGRENILLSRQQCRPVELPNTVLDFVYQPD